jgi:hypothetical protein
VKGLTVGVWVETLGTTTVGLTSAGAETLPIVDMSGFAEDGGTALVGGVEVVYTAAVDDDAGDYLTLAAALDADVPDGTDVLVSPLVQHKLALVDVGDGEVYECDIPSGHLWADARLAETAEGGQSVEVEPTRHGQWRVVGVDGSPPTPDLSYGAPSSLLPEAVNVDEWTTQGKTVDLLNRESAHHPELTLIGATNLTTADGSGEQQVKTGPGGLTIADEEGKPLWTVASEAGSRPHVSGLADFDSITFDTGAVTQQLDLLPGSAVNISQQFPPPSHGPTAATHWEFIASPDLAADFQPSGLVRDSAAFWTVAGLAVENVQYLTEIGDDGTLTHHWALPSDLYCANGLTLIGSTWWVAGFSRSGGLDTPTLLVPLDASGASAGDTIQYQRLAEAAIPAVGTDGTNILVADVRPGNARVRVTAIDPATGATVSVTNLPALPASGSRQLAGVQFGSFDFGEDCYVVWADFENKREVLVCKASDLSDWDSVNLNFAFAQGESPLAACWADDLTRFASIGQSMGVWLYANNELNGLALSFLLTETLYNSHPYETTIAPKFTKLKGARRGGLRINAGTLPGAGGPSDPETYRIYLCNLDGLFLGDWYLQGTTDPLTGDLVVVNPTFMSGQPPAVNSFPTGDYAPITRDGVTEVLTPVGDGTYTGELVTYVSALIAAGGGGGGTGGVDIDCGNASASGVEIDCGAA